MRRILVLATVAMLVLGACSTSDPSADPGPSTSTGRGGEVPVDLIASLEPFDSCDALLEDVRAEAADRVGPYGLEGPGYGGDVVLEDDVATAEAGAAEDRQEADASAAPASPPSTSPAASPDGTGTTYSDTNVQEAGVDEPDLVKTDGARVVVVTDGSLQVLRADGGAPELLGALALPDVAPQELFLRADRALLLGTAYDVSVDDLLEGDQQPTDQGGAPADTTTADVAYPGAAPVTAIVEVDLSDPAVPRVVATQYVEGSYLSARAVDGTARIVVTSSPQPELVQPAYGDLGPDVDDPDDLEEAATRANRQAVERSDLADWVPQVATVSADGITGGPVAPCERISRPAEFSGFGTLSVLTADLDQPLGDLQAVSVMADGETVYAGTDGLYVATNRWGTTDDDPGDALVDDYTTEIHRFGIAVGGPATYEASGAVRGHLLNQFSLSEFDGHLRVATTDGAPWEGSSSESYVTVLRQEGEELRQVGQVGDLGRGEEIFAVRFQGDVGYVVTFEQTDPLYTLDLADPTAPQVVGELKILGYSAYLHPAGDGLLIGVGQDATEDGALLGTQVSLFDVGDLASPERIQQAAVGGSSSSSVEYDHRAFLWWPDASTAVIPVEDYETGFTGVVVYRIGPDGITERGRIDHAGLLPGQDPTGRQQPPTPPTTCPPEADCIEPLPCPPGLDCVEPLPASGAPILRSLVIGDQLWTVSAQGVRVNDLATLADEGSVTF